MLAKVYPTFLDELTLDSEVGYDFTAMSKLSERLKTEKRGGYPYYALGKCLDLAKIVCELGGNKNRVQRSLIAQQMQIDEDSASLSQIIAATKCFGLIEGWGTFTLTDLARKYFFPTDETEKRKSLLEVVKCPTVFEKLIQRFDGNKLPANDMIANLIHREMEVPESWKARAASLFSAAMRDIEVIDANGFLRYAASRHALDARIPVPGDGQQRNKDESSMHQEEKRPRIDPPPPQSDQQPSDRFAMALLEKFPDFDPSWGPEQQTAWFAAYQKLLAMNAKGGDL